jgi:hypothetical protein
MLLGQSFARIHAPVPDFRIGQGTAQLPRALVEKGPYVRFVWTICSDSQLDHHPDSGYRPDFGEGQGFLRVERQVTVPFPEQRVYLFLIRTYVYAFATLLSEQRQILAEALRTMPAGIVAYKGLTGQIEAAIDLLLK